MKDLGLLYPYILIFLSAKSTNLLPSPFNFTCVSQQLFRSLLFSYLSKLYCFCLSFYGVLRDQRLSQTDRIQFIKTGWYLRYLSLDKCKSPLFWVLDNLKVFSENKSQNSVTLKNKKQEYLLNIYACFYHLWIILSFFIPNIPSMPIIYTSSDMDFCLHLATFLSLLHLINSK